MDAVDRDLEKAEQDASPERFPDASSVAEKAGPRSGAASVLSSSSSSSTSVVREPIHLNQVNTQRDLERHPTALSRIETQRTQHSGTVGRSPTSRSSKKPLPNFGGGKEYPPPLPEREEYVVEFDGPDDPLHPVNWSMKKKCGSPPNNDALGARM